MGYVACVSMCARPSSRLFGSFLRPILEYVIVQISIRYVIRGYSRPSKVKHTYNRVLTFCLVLRPSSTQYTADSAAGNNKHTLARYPLNSLFHAGKHYTPAQPHSVPARRKLSWTHPTHHPPTHSQTFCAHAAVTSSSIVVVLLSIFFTCYLHSLTLHFYHCINIFSNWLGE